MNKNEFNRMISLADEKYVDEIFEDRLSGKRKNIFVTFTAAAAALAAAVVGIGYFVSTAGSDGIEMPEPAVIIDDVTEAEVTDVTAVAVPIDCEEIFKNKGGEFPISFYCRFDDEFGNDSQNSFDADYIKSIIPFSAEGYSDERNQFYAYCDGNNEPYGISLYLESEFDETASPKFRSIKIDICAKGRLERYFPEEAEPVSCFGVDIYGFDDTANYYEGAYDRNLKAYFVIGDTEYAVETSNLSCEETVKIIEDIIKSGFSFTALDLSRGSDFDYKTKEMSLAEANKIEPFAGHVPQLENVMSLYKNVTYAVEKNDGEEVWSALYFSFSNYYSSGNTNEKRILFHYYTREWRDTKNFDNVINWQDITQESLDACMVGDEYKFTLICDGFMINVTAKCAADELWAYIENIRDDTFSTENNTITLAEAANTPFAELVPKTEKIGDLSVGNIYLEKDGENTTLTMDYSSQGRVGAFSYYGLVYHTDSRRVLENVVPIEIITKEYIEQLAAEPSGAGNNKRFELSIDCGGIWINIYGDCTSEELWEYVSAINGGTSGNFDFSAFGTLAEANKLEHFAGYVPTVKEIGDMKISTENGSEVAAADSEEYGRVLNICYQSEVTSGDVYGGSDFKAIALTYTEKKEYNIPEAPIVRFEDILFADLDAYKTDGIRGGGRNCYRFVIDCGTCFITVAADCTPDEMQTYITSLVIDNEFGNKVTAEEEELKRRQEEEAEEERKRTEEEAKKAESLVNAKLISLEKLKELAEKGGELMWDDFDGYDFEDVGSGLCIRVYGVEGGYTVMVGGGSLKEKPMYVYLDGNGKRIDMRYESIDGILN